jgi:hypothetical protein
MEIFGQEPEGGEDEDAPQAVSGEWGSGRFGFNGVSPHVPDALPRSEPPASEAVEPSPEAGSVSGPVAGTHFTTAESEVPGKLDGVISVAPNGAAAWQAEAASAEPEAEKPGAENPAAQIPETETPGMRAADEPDAAAVVDLHGVGFTKAAAECAARARDIAQILNHTRVGAAHLILAMTLDENISRKMQRDFDVPTARRTMLKKLSEADWDYGIGAENAPEIGRDLADIFTLAAAEAAERGQDVSLFDLFRGFELADARNRLLVDEIRQSDPAPAIAARVQQTLMPQISVLIDEFRRSMAMEFRSQLDRATGDIVAVLCEQIHSIRIEPGVPAAAAPEGSFRRTIDSIFGNRTAET